MRLIERYLFRQLLTPTLLAAAALGAVGLLSQSLGQLDIIIEQRQTAWVFLKVIVLAMPQLLNLILPIAVFVAALVALNRLHAEHELVVCYAAGMSRWRVMAPGMRLAVMATLIGLAVNLWVQPASYRAMREIFYAAKTDLAATLVREGEFTEPAPRLTVYGQTVESDGKIRNLFIHHRTEKGGATTYTAKEGRITAADVETYARRFPSAIYFLCGSQGYMDTTRQWLLAAGVAAARVRVESFDRTSLAAGGAGVAVGAGGAGGAR